MELALGTRPVTPPETGASRGSGRTERSSMDAVTKKHDTTALPADIRAETQPAGERPTRAEAEAAVRTLIAYAGDDPAREGLLDTPRRVVAAYDELFGGYHASPVD